jgi:hypothetical protein
LPSENGLQSPFLTTVTWKEVSPAGSVTIGMIRGRMFLMRPSSKRENRVFVVRNATERKHVWISGRPFIDSVFRATERLRKKERNQVLFFAENVTLRDSDVWSGGRE